MAKQRKHTRVLVGTRNYLLYHIGTIIALFCKKKRTDLPQGQKIGLLQEKNGPCGVLAALNAIIISKCLYLPNFNTDFEISARYKIIEVLLSEIRIVAESIAAILIKARVSDTDPCKLAKWKGAT